MHFKEEQLKLREQKILVGEPVDQQYTENMNVVLKSIPASEKCQIKPIKTEHTYIL